MGKPRLEIRRDVDATVLSYMREDGLFAAVRIADDSDVETISGQLRVLAEAMMRSLPNCSNSFNARRPKR